LPTSTFDVTLEATLTDGVTLNGGDELCVQQLGNHVVVDITANPDITTRAIVVPADGPNRDQCSSPFVRATVTSGTPPNPLELGGFACVGLAGNV
jgi:hypothetical protein